MRMGKVAILLIAMLVLTATAALAAPPGQGSITAYPGGGVSQLDVRYNISSMMGEPTINGTYRWQGSAGSLNYNTVVWLKITNNINGSAWIRIDPAVPRRGEWAYNVTGSPNWSSVLVSSWSGNRATGYVDAGIAKQFWRNGFWVSEARLGY